MLASFVICQACGCKGRAGNTLSQNQSESPVFRYHGHDPFEGIMRYFCTNCKTILLVDPMDMLSSFCARGVPEPVQEMTDKKPNAKAILQTGRILRIIPKRINALKHH